LLYITDAITPCLAEMLASGAVLRLPSGSTTAAASTPTTMTSSQICATQLPVFRAWSSTVPSTISGACRPGPVQPISSEIKSIAVTPGEYLVSHVVNGKPFLPLTSSSVGQTLASVSSTVSVNVKVILH